MMMETHMIVQDSNESSSSWDTVFLSLPPPLSLIIQFLLYLGNIETIIFSSCCALMFFCKL